MVAKSHQGKFGGKMRAAAERAEKKQYVVFSEPTILRKIMQVGQRWMVSLGRQSPLQNPLEAAHPLTQP